MKNRKNHGRILKYLLMKQVGIVHSFRCYHSSEVLNLKKIISEKKHNNKINQCKHLMIFKIEELRMDFKHLKED